MEPLHLGVVLPNYGDAFAPARLVAAARAAEAAGYDSGWLTDHVLPPAEQAGVYGTIAEALVAAGFLAGQTERLRLGISALVVPQREPLLALKQLVTLDVLSGGRLITAVAAGWLRPEFATLGAGFEDRGRRLDDWLDLVAALLRQAPGRVAYGGRIPVADGWLAPAPARPLGLELWVAGASERSLRRAARTRVWHPVGLPASRLRTLAAAFRDQVPGGRVVLRVAAYLGDRPDRDARDERGRPALAGPASWVAEQLNDYLDAGADGFVLNLDHRAPDLEARIERFAAEVRPLLLAPARA
jgi:alkanesulfonate monooxygenase SsuD/methylene tetrahydromethanopterin reductase-like flavin-dependent oxidoreductase (luciferase family)